MADGLLISVKPRFAEGLLNGTKTVELRRVKPDLLPGDSVFLYTTLPVQQISGYFVVKNIVAAAPANLWRRFGTQCGVTRQEFHAYYQECSLGYAIVVAQALRLVKPVSLQELRLTYPPFHPPQGYFYLRGSRQIVPLLDAERRAA